MNHNHLKYWLALLHMQKVNPRTILDWLSHFNDVETLFHAQPSAWRAAGINENHIALLQNPPWKAVHADLNWQHEQHHHLLTYTDDDYPFLLKQIPDPPLVLYVKGNKSILSQQQLAIVGARHPTQEGKTNAEQFAFSLSRANLVVTSGLAIGIDSASHRGALLAKGHTIAVLGTGLHHIYPRSNHKLADEIVSNGGALISEFPLTTPPYSYNFPRRNRIIAGLSLGVLVVMAAIKSGSLITARYALDFNREIFALPGSIHHPLQKGCHYLIKQGAKLVENETDILEELGIICKTNPPFEGNSLSYQNDLSPEYQQLLQRIDYEVTDLDTILLQSRLTAGEVSSMLLILELNGYIQTTVGGYIRVAMRDKNGDKKSCLKY
ncbi:MAG: DNA protecting protein DprA [Gammaproteobacteria bacterium RIFCSPHIGHO2_12_FULL_38_14]|nr:MAG: DNA protecting protein DprA [Gammaproteobacteria bacterium RIFCSPHIGHO2_12_FULL_38_14]